MAKRPAGPVAMRPSSVPLSLLANQPSPSRYGRDDNLGGSNLIRGRFYRSCAAERNTLTISAIGADDAIPPNRGPQDPATGDLMTRSAVRTSECWGAERPAAAGC